jgi:ABC-type oligopeptide transport system substrate-binding subunit
MSLKDMKKSPVSRQAFFHSLLWFFAATALLGATPSYSVGLADSFPGKEAPSPTSEGVTTHTLRALTVLDSARYSDDFTHFSYADPDARKRGTLRTAEVGTFHNLAPFILHQSSVQV